MKKTQLMEIFYPDYPVLNKDEKQRKCLVCKKLFKTTNYRRICSVCYQRSNDRTNLRNDDWRFF